MKNVPRTLLLAVALSAASAVYAASNVAPPLNVTVSKDGKAAFKGTTNSNGYFSTGKLEPGNYVVQFNAKDAASVKGEQLSLVVSAGKKKVTSDGVAGEKFAAGGVAMKLDVGNNMNVTGQAITAKAAAASQEKGSAGSAKIKIMNGKRYVWVGPETGSNMGGRWVEEGSVGPSNVRRGGSLGSAQDRASRESAPSGN